ncbi:hypothetical protein PGT21_025941 [Puccinia graminis f. sp. tritici]|uniref:Uncharacterized protein n=1 Tax=Puccinia graminis f. sp. tritici TaxID=56615 RepID=A0A5B0MS86_PUCGR|nr:hypothetical protein PGT21_025941 [Puccinia graminis f. sp. tritici]
MWCQFLIVAWIFTSIHSVYGHEYMRVFPGLDGITHVQYSSVIPGSNMFREKNVKTARIRTKDLYPFFKNIDEGERLMQVFTEAERRNSGNHLGYYIVADEAPLAEALHWYQLDPSVIPVAADSSISIGINQVIKKFLK